MTEFDINPTFYLIKKANKEETREYKEYRRKWNENPMNFIVKDFPIHIDIETNTNCNLRCFMCIQSFDTPKKVEIDFELVKRIIDEGSQRGACSLKSQYRGEPLLYEKTPELVKYAKEKGYIEVMFNTNANLLTEEISKALIEADLDKIICSIDGYTKDVYEEVRIGGNFETVLKNVKGLQELKKKYNSETPLIRVQMVDTPKNHHQIEEYIKFWGEIADEVAVEDMLDWESMEEDSTPLVGWACAQLWQRLIILADGDVLPCCRAINKGNDKLEVLGSVYTESIENIWKGKKLTALRNLHKQGLSHEIKMCRLCGLRKSVISRKSND